MRELASVQAAAPDDDDVGPVPRASPHSAGAQPAAALVQPRVSDVSDHWIREDQRMPVGDREQLAQCWSVAGPLEPTPVVAPPALCVPPALRRACNRP